MKFHEILTSQQLIEVIQWDSNAVCLQLLSRPGWSNCSSVWKEKNKNESE